MDNPISIWTIVLIYLVLGLVSTFGAGFVLSIRARDPKERAGMVAEKVFATVFLFIPLWPVFLARMFRSSTCAYCGKPAKDIRGTRRHFLSCPKHPMYPVLQAAEAFIDQTREIPLPADAALAEVELSRAITRLYEEAGVCPGVGEDD